MACKAFPCPHIRAQIVGYPSIQPLDANNFPYSISFTQWQKKNIFTNKMFQLSPNLGFILISPFEQEYNFRVNKSSTLVSWCKTNHTHTHIHTNHTLIECSSMCSYASTKQLIQRLQCKIYKKYKVRSFPQAAKSFIRKCQRIQV